MAGRIPQNFIDELIARTDIVEVIHARVPLKRKGKEYMACCPFHNEKTPSFTVSEPKQFYHCFGCGAHGNAIGFLMEFEHLDYVEAIEALAADQHLDVPREGGRGQGQPREATQPLYDALQQAASVYRQALGRSQRAIDYLKQRGLSGEIAKKYRIGYAPDDWHFLAGQLRPPVDDDTLLKVGLLIRNDRGKTYDRFRDRILFPITDPRGRTIGFGGRILDKGEPKYLNSPENRVFHKGSELYGLYEARKSLQKITRLMVVEGYMDVVALSQHGIDYAVASLGTATTTEQIQKLFRSSHELVFCYDGDNAGRKAAWRALENTLGVIRDGMVARFLFLPDGEDPDSLIRQEGKAAFEQRIENALPLSDFLFDNLKRQNDVSSSEGKARLGEQAKPLIKRLHNGLLKDLLLEQLAGILGLQSDRLEARVVEPVAPVRPAPRRAAPRRQQVKNNKTRIAIAMLIQNPSLGNRCPVPADFADAMTRGLPLLHDLQQTIEQNPGITSSALLERYRGHEHESALHNLLMLDTPETANKKHLEDEYKQLIARLHKEERDAYFQHKFANNLPLTEEEKREYLSATPLAGQPDDRPGTGPGGGPDDGNKTGEQTTD